MSRPHVDIDVKFEICHDGRIQGFDIHAENLKHGSDLLIRNRHDVKADVALFVRRGGRTHCKCLLAGFIGFCLRASCWRSVNQTS